LEEPRCPSFEIAVFGRNVRKCMSYSFGAVHIAPPIRTG
jgi:hypothetical protein